MEKKTRAAEVMGGERSKKDKKPSKKAKAMRIRKAAGGYIASHEYDPPEEGQTPDHVVPGDLKALMSHVGQHMEEPDEAPAEA